MNRSKIAWSLGIMAILLTSTVATVLPVPVKAANVTITTSTDKFYGPALVKVTINAPDDNADSSEFDTSNIDIEIKDKNGVTKVPATSFTLNETGQNTGSFELFIAAHTNATAKNPSSGSTIVRIYDDAKDDHGDSTDPTDREVGIDHPLVKGDKIIVRHPRSGVEQTITYEPTTATLSTDRATAGKGNIIKIVVTDQDANLDPTGIDKFNANSSSTTIITASGATLDLYDNTGGKNVTFTETGANTGVFELYVNVTNDKDADSTDNIAVLKEVTFSSSASFILKDHNVYHQTNDKYPSDTTLDVNTDPQNSGADFDIPDATTSTKSKTVQLQNTDGQITLTKDLTIGNGFAIKITDPDRNVRTDVEDTFTGRVYINSTELNNLSFKETGDNTGVFVPDLSNNRIPIVVVPDTDGKTKIDVDKVNNRVEVDAGDIAKEPDIQIAYKDLVDKSGNVKSFNITRQIQHESGTISTETPTVSVTGKVIIIIDDMDLNRDSTVQDSHTVNNPSSWADIANGLGKLKISVPGKTVNTAPNIVFTEINASESGMFRGEFDVEDLGGVTLEDGDKIKVEYTDNTEDPSVTRTVNISVSVASVNVELDRNSYPPSHQTARHSDNVDNGGDGTADDEIGRNVVIHVLITDPSENKSPTSEDSITLNKNNFKLELLDSTNYTIYPGNNTANNNNSLPTQNAAGAQFKPISDTSADETGVDTGVFKVDITLPAKIGNTVIDDDYQIKITYTSSNGDDASDTASIKSTTATISTDSLSYTLGQDIILTINEPDWNTDSEEIDVLNADLSAIFIDARKDGTLADVVAASGGNMDLDPDQIEETGPNTGVFRITIENINEQFVERGRTIKIELEDGTTDGASGTETITHTVTVTSGIPEIIFDKEVYTPFDEVCVTIVDPSANLDPDTKDKLNLVKVEVGEFEDQFKSTSNNKFEETGVDTGVFMFKGDECIQLDANEWSNGNDGTPGNDGTLPAARDKAVRVTYETETGDIELTKSALIVFNDGSISFDKNTYKVGDRAVITVVDPDLNEDPDVQDTLTVDVWSSTDRAGVTITLRETGDKTGIFKGEVLLSSDVSSGSRLQVSDGDTLTARYTDRTLPDPADYDEDNDATRSIDTQRLDATATVGISKFPTERAPASMPEIVDELGSTVSEVTVGQQVLISSKVTNNQTIKQEFVQIVKVTDADGNVVLLSFTQGVLNPNEKRTNAFSWTPEKAGTYRIEIFVWESFTNPVALSPKITETIEVT